MRPVSHNEARVAKPIHLLGTKTRGGPPHSTHKGLSNQNQNGPTTRKMQKTAVLSEI